MPVEQAAPAATAPDPTDFQAWEQAEKAGTSEPITPSAEAAPAAEPAAEPKIETPSEPAGEPEKVETIPEPEAGKSQELVPTAEQDKEHSPRWYRREVKRIERESRERVAALEAKLAEIKLPAPAAAPAVIPATPAAEPKEEDFESIAAYARAIAIWNSEQVAERKVTDFKQSVDRQLRAEQAEARTRQQQIERANQDRQWAEKVEEGKKIHPDFEEVVFESDNESIGPWTAQAVQLLPNAHEVAYFLAKTPQEAARISVLPQFQQTLELGALNARFNKTQAPKTNGSSKREPQPVPITPLGGGGESAGIVDTNSPELALDYAAWERAELKQKNRRR